MAEKLVPFLSCEKISDVIKSLAKKVSADYSKILQGHESLVTIVTLKGAAFFATDFLRELTVPVNMDFIRVASYGAGTKSSGNVRILKDIETNIEGQHVLILDEIVDSGRTLQFLIDRMGNSRPKSLRVGALLSKPSRREIEVKVDYLGLEVEDKFLVGYGLDFGEKYRNLKEIFVLEQ